MYIPVTYFGGVGGLIASGGVESTYVTGSVRYKVHEFRGISGSFQILSGRSNRIDILVVGGGGRNGTLNGTVPQEVFGGGGGAGGYIYSSSISLESGSFSVSGATPAGSAPGLNSFISSSQINLTAIGGGRGGDWLGGSSYSNGGSGGSGGGAAGLSSSPGNGTSGQGFTGGNGSFTSSLGGFYFGGGGGGAGANASGFYGGIGKINRIKNGQTLWYAGGAGGPGFSSIKREGSGSATWPQNTPGGNDNSNLAAGGGGNADDNTTPGTVIIRYPYQNVELWNCSCVKFEQIIVFPSFAPTSSLISYVEGQTGRFYEGVVVPITNPQYKLIVSGTLNQISAYPEPLVGPDVSYMQTSLVALSFCSSSYEVPLYTSNTTMSVCSDTTLDTYYMSLTQPVEVGSTLYTNSALTTAVTASYFKQQGSSDYFTTDNSGVIQSFNTCPAIPTGSVWTFAAGSQPPYVNYSFIRLDGTTCTGQMNPNTSRNFCVKNGTTPTNSSPVGGNPGNWYSSATPCGDNTCSAI